MRFFLVLAIVALSIPALQSAEKMTLSLDVCQFRFSTDSSLVEVYYGLYAPANIANTAPAENLLVLALTIFNGREQIVNNIWKVEAQPQDSADPATPHMIIDVMRYLLPAGNYDFKLTARDMNDPNRSDSIAVKDFKVHTFGPQALAMSSLEFAQEITPVPGDSEDRFFKNRFRVVPNPLTLYGETNNQVYYYFENYNLPTRFGDSFYIIKRTVVDSYGLPLAAIPVDLKKKRIRGNDAAEVGMFDVSAVPSGTYFLHFVLMDESNKEYSSMQKRFYIHNPNVAPIQRDTLPLQSQVASSEIALLSPEDVEILTTIVHDYLGEEHDRKIVEALLTDTARREFLYRYWKSRDTNPNTGFFEPLQEMMQRIRFSSDNYSESQLAGWRTDRGRIFITYGKPTEIQRYPNVADFKEFEAWSYDEIEHGVVFIFAVKGAFGDLSLIHSTKTGELQNELWFDLVKVTSGSTGLSSEAQGTDRMDLLRDTFRSYGLELPRYLR
ncbi:MAG: GWxTD domain-containing protein [Candidatus Zhuqueibacterota bacterium]